jgi:hypothetical protein
VDRARTLAERRVGIAKLRHRSSLLNSKTQAGDIVSQRKSPQKSLVRSVSTRNTTGCERGPGTECSYVFLSAILLRPRLATVPIIEWLQILSIPIAVRRGSWETLSVQGRQPRATSSCVSSSIFGIRSAPPAGPMANEISVTARVCNSILDRNHVPLAGISTRDKTSVSRVRSPRLLSMYEACRPSNESQSRIAPPAREVKFLM